jgi:spore coat protein CotH
MLATVVEDADVGRLQRRLPKVLDVNRFISLMAMDVILDNWDGYTFNIKNYEAYHDPETGRMVFMPHDLDQVLRDVDASLIPNPRGMVSQAILRNPQTRAAYQARVAELAKKVFVASTLVQRLDAQAALLHRGLKDYDPNLATEVLGQVGSLKERIKNRAQVLAGRMKEVQGGEGSVGR